MVVISNQKYIRSWWWWRETEQKHNRTKTIKKTKMSENKKWNGNENEGEQEQEQEQVICWTTKYQNQNQINTYIKKKRFVTVVKGTHIGTLGDGAIWMW